MEDRWRSLGHQHPRQDFVSFHDISWLPGPQVLEEIQIASFEPEVAELQVPAEAHQEASYSVR